MSNTAVVTSGNVDGNVSNCQLLEETTNVSYKSAFSITGEYTTSVMNSCTGEIVNEYTNRDFTAFGVIIFLAVSTALIVFVFARTISRY